jgi:hypothetical protein
MTLDVIKELIKENIIEIGIPKLLSGIFTKGIPTLERWK